MAMTGLWEKHYEGELSRLAYGDTTTYYRGAEWLALCQTIEDWGCGLGYFKTCCMFPERVVGIDGSWSRFADKTVDLREYTSNVEGIFMRHVLEHNLEWERILENALASFTRRMCLVLFTPLLETHAILGYTDLGAPQQTPVGLLSHPDPLRHIPDQAFTRAELVDRMGPWLVEEEALTTRTQYGGEHVFYLEKP